MLNTSKLHSAGKKMSNQFAFIKIISFKCIWPRAIHGPDSIEFNLKQSWAIFWPGYLHEVVI